MSEIASTLAESRRLEEDSSRTHNWKRWGPYLSERQWGTVREDYSADGSSWTYFPHDHARSRAYRWGEDGLMGLTDRECRLCFAVALWNGKDPILKERLYGLSGPEGNHGEDVKECYYYLDSTPTHSYMKTLYKYPQAEFPYARLLEENERRGRKVGEFELADTGVFDGSRYFDVFVEYAKAGPEDVLVKVTVANRGPERARVHVLPTLWFRNTWVWGCKHEGCEVKPRMWGEGPATVHTDHASLGRHRFSVDRGPDGKFAPLLFTENETNNERLFDAPNLSKWVKDGNESFVIRGVKEAVNPKPFGTKVAPHFVPDLGPGEEAVVRLRLTLESEATDAPFGAEFEDVFTTRKSEADAFYDSHMPAHLTPSERGVMRQAYAGLLWSKQFYHYIVKDWLDGDPSMPPPPARRFNGRNADWGHLFNRDVISMPDKWEYPWYAAWDLAFHMIPFAKIDPRFAKDQLILFLREWYMHPNGQVPAYEWALGDVNPPVHAWSCFRVYKMTGPRGGRDRVFLGRVFQKLMINFTWWVNRKDVSGKHLFSGGFLGLDNVGVFDRSQPLPTGGHLEQADGTAWMAFFCNEMLSMALELATESPEYEDVASKFFEHFIAIADAMNCLGGNGLWDEEDGFYYDQIRHEGRTTPLRVRSMVGLLPLIACSTLEYNTIRRLTGFKKRMAWFLEHRQDLAQRISYFETLGTSAQPRYLLAIPSRDRLERTLRYMLDEKEFLSPYGIRSVSAVHKDRPYIFRADGREYRVDYVPGESNSDLFGGNSNWRGPVWFPVNYLLVEALERYHHFYGDTLKVECPTGSGRWMNLQEVAAELSMRLARIFIPDAAGKRPCHGNDPRYASDPHWKDLVLFYEYFHGDNGSGVGANHQTGWTSLVTRCLGAKKSPA
ncbi:MAG: glucosidase [Planctomycetes bacterium]|nr:glucosidase [Planctomycetota bacterium]